MKSEVEAMARKQIERLRRERATVGRWKLTLDDLPSQAFFEWATVNTWSAKTETQDPFMNLRPKEKEQTLITGQEAAQER
jgi:hypothetical protein